MPIERMTLRTNSRFCISWCWIFTMRMRMIVSEYLPRDVFLKFRVRTQTNVKLSGSLFRTSSCDTWQFSRWKSPQNAPGSASRICICRYCNQILHDRQSAHCKSSEVPFIYWAYWACWTILKRLYWISASNKLIETQLGLSLEVLGGTARFLKMMIRNFPNHRLPFC